LKETHDVLTEDELAGAVLASFTRQARERDDDERNCN
jgi:hypothetical protein